MSSTRITNVFKKDADKSILLQILKAALMLRVKLFGAPKKVVQHVIHDFLEENFDDNHSQIKLQIIRNLKFEEVKYSLLMEMENYILSIEEKEVQAILEKEIQNCSAKYGAELLLDFFVKCHNEGCKYIRYWQSPDSKQNDDREINHYTEQWGMLNNKITKRYLLNEYIARSLPEIKVGQAIGLILIIFLGLRISSEFTAGVFSFAMEDERLERMKELDRYATNAAILGFVLLFAYKSLVKVKKHIVLDFGTFQDQINYLMDESLDRFHKVNHDASFPLLTGIIPQRDGATKSQVHDEDALPKGIKTKTKGQVSASVAHDHKDEKSSSSKDIVRVGTTTYFLLSSCAAGTYYRHNADEQYQAVDAKSGKENLLLNAMEATVEKHPKIHPEDHPGIGIKKVGVSEKGKFKGPYKLKLVGKMFGKLRIDIKERAPNAKDLENIGADCKVILSPKGIVHK